MAYEPLASGITLYNRTGAAISPDSLRFGEAGWKRGRDLGFAFALQKKTSNFYLWTQGADGKPLGRHPLCDGKLLDSSGDPVRVDEITTFTIGDLTGVGSSYLVAATAGGKKLVAWNLTRCQGPGNFKQVAQLAAPISGDLIAGDFDGQGKDLLQTIAPDTGELLQWELESTSFRELRRATLRIAPHVDDRIHGVTYVGITRLPRDSDNVAFETASVVLHDRGVTLFRNDLPVAFYPNCAFRPVNCAYKTLLFNLDQGLTDGLQDMARKDKVQAGAVLDRMIAALLSVRRHYAVWALINPIQEDRQATIFILDKLAAARIPFVFDYYSSDVTNLAYIKKDSLDYEPRAFAPLKGVSLDLKGAASSQDSVEYYARRYGEQFIGLRIMERLGIDINVRDPNGRPMVADSGLAQRELAFDWDLADSALEWTRHSKRYLIWADPWLYLPYECYLNPVALQAERNSRDAFIRREKQLAERFSNLIPMYDNNEGLKRCGVAFGNWLITPRNFRLPTWERIPSSIASAKHGIGQLDGPMGLGLSVQSWTSDYDPIISAGTLPPEEVVIWTLAGFAKGATILEFEPYFYFFAWPPTQGSSQSVPPNNKQRVGDPRTTLNLLISALEY